MLIVGNHHLLAGGLVYKDRDAGIYFSQMGCKIEGGFTDIFGFQMRYFFA